ncbi:sporulation histidine kinase inhibitor Sda [bacterium LRH843]|nr:sporulation histidine kinase inhibitor Sda [bacterium LRH843]
MLLLSDEALIVSYRKAIKYKLDEEFIKILEEEMTKRSLLINDNKKLAIY